jgi:hypothetical protein
MSWYPRIELITDSLGNSLAAGEDSSTIVIPARLQVGDVLTFRCVGWDPQDRELTWTLKAQAIPPPLDGLRRKCDRLLRRGATP